MSKAEPSNNICTPTDNNNVRPISVKANQAIARNGIVEQVAFDEQLTETTVEETVSRYLVQNIRAISDSLRDLFP